MIVIKIFNNLEDNLIKGFSIKGHTNKAPLGYDIYCAGISALSQSVVLTLTTYLNLSCEIESEEGKLFCELKDNPNKVTEGIFQTMLIGFKEIQKLIPDLIKIELK